MKKTIRILIFAIVIQAVSGFGTIGLSNDTFSKYGEKVLIKFKQLEQAEELLVLAPLPENAVAENVNIIKSNFFEDSEFILPDGTKPVGDCDLVEYNGERYIKIKSYTDPDFITALKLKYTGQSEIIGWIDEITNPELLSKLDKLPTAAYTNLENDITSASANALKEAFNSEPELVESWNQLTNAPDAIRKNIDVLDDVTGWPASWNLNTVENSVEVVQSSGRKIATITDGKIVAPARTLTGTAGNPLLNRVPLVKNTIYEVDGFEFLTDNLGRVTKTNADLDDLVRIRLGNQQIRAVDIKDGANGVDQGGHIVASRFFGPGEQINLYPQSANLNQGAWKQMENNWATEMVAGKDVKIEVEAVFSGISQRPTSFQVKYTIDGQPFQENFINQ